jgi:hypothetical protein
VAARGARAAARPDVAGRVLVTEPWPEVEGLHDGLRDLGYSQGRNLLIEYRFAEGDAGRFPGLAAELARLPVDVIVTWGTPATLAAIKATNSIPIIMSAGDPVGAGLVASSPGLGETSPGFLRKPLEGRKNGYSCSRTCYQLFHTLWCCPTRQTRTA